MGVVNEPVEYGVGVSWIPDNLMPCRHRKLAGDDGRAAAIAILEDFEEVMACLGVERLKPPIVEDQQLDAAERALQARIAPVAPGKRQVGVA